MIGIFIDRLFNRLDAYYRWSPSLGHYVAVYKPLTSLLVERHLEGMETLSAPALSTGGHCKWCAWDSDTADDSLDKIESMLNGLAWQCLREGRREGRSGHLWLCFSAPVPAGDLIIFDKQIRQRAGITSSKLEFFPKQQKADLGSGLRLPLGFNRKPGVNLRGWFDVPPNTVSEQLQWFAAQPLNPTNVISQLATSIRVKEAAEKKRYVHYVGSKGDWTLVPFEVAVKRTEAKLGSQGWYRGHCPLKGNHDHGDRNPSLALRPGEQGQAIVKCWRGCQAREIYAALI